jgi:glycerol-3-phosphate O-acyltransferase
LFETVSIPLWLVALAGILALIGLLDRIVGPGLRWFFRRKANAAIDELNTRLQLSIQPFKTTRRKSLIDGLLFDPQVVKAAEIQAREEDVPREVAMARAKRYAQEIVPAFNAYAYFSIGTRLSRWISRLLYRVRLGYADDKALSAIEEDATVVFVMNHRSNMDYVLVTYLASASATLSYAVGEWARVWLLQSIIRAMGAYFIRRDSGNLLYRRVLSRYVAMATRSGVTQAMFPEGGLSRDGLLREPKFGLLSYMIGEFNPAEDRDVVFVPVGLNYDRVIEDRVLTGAVRSSLEVSTHGADRPGGPGDEADFRLKSGSVRSFLFDLVKRYFKGELYRYGYACASFGQPISLRDWLTNEGEEDRSTMVECFGTHVMNRVGQVVPVLPVSLVATVFTSYLDRDEDGIAQDGLTELELKARAFALMKRLEAGGAHIHIPRMDRDYAISAGLRMLTLRHLVTENSGLFRVAEGEHALIHFYANSIAHLLPGTLQK